MRGGAIALGGDAQAARAGSFGDARRQRPGGLGRRADNRRDLNAGGGGGAGELSGTRRLGMRGGRIDEGCGGRGGGRRRRRLNDGLGIERLLGAGCKRREPPEWRPMTAGWRPF